jgi:hypothetical protein
MGSSINYAQEVLIFAGNYTLYSQTKVRNMHLVRVLKLRSQDRDYAKIDRSHILAIAACNSGLHCNL